MTKSNLILFFSVSFLWSLSFLFMKVGVPEFGIYTFVGLRIIIAAFVMLAFMLLYKRNLLAQIKKHYLIVTITGLTNLAIPFSLFSYAITHLSAGICAVLNSFAPMFAVCIGHLFFNEKLNKKQFIGICFSIFGVFIISFAKIKNESNDLLAIFAALGACLSYAISINLTKKFASNNVSSFSLSTGSLLVASLIMLPFVIAYFPEKSVSNVAWFAIFGIAIFSTAIAFILFYNLLSKVGVAKAIGCVLITPIFTMIISIFLLNERIILVNSIGAVIILFGTFLVLFNNNANNLNK